MCEFFSAVSPLPKSLVERGRGTLALVFTTLALI